MPLPLLLSRGSSAARRRARSNGRSRRSSPTAQVFRLEPLEDRTLLSLQTLATFDTSNGAFPYTDLYEDANGDLFGTTLAGGDFGDGTVFEVEKDSGIVTTVASFEGSNGASPLGGVVADGNGDLFGTTGSGGAANFGTIFEVDAASHIITDLYTFSGSDGANPHAGLITLPRRRPFMATTQNGGSGYDAATDNPGYGTVFSLTPTNSSDPSNPYNNIPFNWQSSFTGSNGAGHYATLTDDINGVLYGTTTHGGTTFSDTSSGDGTLFNVSTGSGAITTIANFNGASGTGTNPYEGVVVAPTGVVWGITGYGGNGYNGTARSGLGTAHFLATPDGTITTIPFTSASTGPASPDAPPILDSAGDVFGTTYSGYNGNGAVYEIKAGTGTISTVYAFSGNPGQNPVGPVILGTDDNNPSSQKNNLFGTTDHSGGSQAGPGTVFEIPFSTNTQIAAPSVTYGQQAQVTVTLSTLFSNEIPTGNVSLSVDGGTPMTQALTNDSASIHCARFTRRQSKYLDRHVRRPGRFPRRLRRRYAARQSRPPHHHVRQRLADLWRSAGAPSSGDGFLTTVDTNVNGENLTVTYDSAGDTATAHASNVPYPIIGKVANGTGLATDYKVTWNGGQLTVNPDPITITIGDAAQTYGGPVASLTDPDFPTTVPTGVNGENLTVTYTSRRRHHHRPRPSPIRSPARSRTAPAWRPTTP